MAKYLLLMTLSLLSACSFEIQPEPQGAWNEWVCDSQAKVYWRPDGADGQSVQVRVGAGDMLHVLKRMPGDNGELYSDSELASRYRLFSQNCLKQAQLIYASFVEAGILKMTPLQIESLTLNAWIILTSWVGFLCTTRENSDQLSEQAIKRGVYQLLVLEAGFVTDQAREAVDELIKEYYVPLENALDSH